MPEPQATNGNGHNGRYNIHFYWRESWRYVLSWIITLAVFGLIIVAPMAHLICAMVHYPVDWPKMEDKPTMELVFMLLGIRGMNSFDRLKGIHNTDLPPLKDEVEK